MRKTVVIGASLNEERYSNQCVRLLRENDIETIAVGNQEGEIADVKIIVGQPFADKVETVAVYLSPKNQESYIDYIIGLKPERILFPPGTENPVFYRKANALGIETEEACPLVMLRTGVY
ncbi:CoA-binding protein [Labilibaculum antarcticum]|uniref:CoA-binding protein n=1 Tax=Labilibaculum antarcticum TaxID=1717717 RepID=A0A1Y1CG89_9BACT|nr:CoA-binding protein [Labilibaculum antarcticum]BAX79387.1 CoA-binding protein [Labilibaculum antarcticum]